MGCIATGKPKEVRNYLGLALIPQAGVAIGLAAMCVRTLGPGVGGDLQTIILASSVLYELIGPACAKLSLYLSKSYSNTLEEITDAAERTEDGTLKKPVELLIERLREIQAQLPEREIISEEEQAFTQAAEEQYEMMSYVSRGRFLNRR